MMMSTKKSLLLTGVAMVAALMVAASASALTITFVNITNNGNSNLSGQLSVEMTDAGGGQVSFQFLNDVGIASSITDVYFDDGTLLGIASITQTAGVDFEQGASPGNLPGGSSITPAFVTSAGFSADSEPPAAPNGVNSATESLTITFNLINGKTFADTVAALGTGELRIGMHVQAIGTTGDSDSYVNNVPDGGMTITLLGMAMAGMGLASRRVKI
jgi:hypothetical protein